MRAASLPETADVVIVGAGFAAAATASALTARDRSVLLLERRLAPGAEASGRSASMIREDVADEALRDLLADGAALHRTGRLARFNPSGSFLLGRGDEDLSMRVPVATGRGRFYPGDGVVDAEALLRRFLAGQALATGVTVNRIEPAGADGLLAVVSDAGVVRASVVVNAAGAWAGRLGGLELVARKRHLFVTESCGASETWPFVWDDDAGYYFRPHGDAFLLCPCDERPREAGDNAVEPMAEEELRAKLARHQPRLPPARIRDSWAGQRTFAPDGRFIVGFDPRVRGLFWLAGLGGHGVTASPALGRLAAEMIDAGPDAEPPPIARALRPERFLETR